jgi:photosystem II stability/assembly factor-like uncharacterized protein
VWGASRGGGVFVSSSEPGTWTHLGEGLGGRHVLSLALVRGTTLAGTDDGIFALAPNETVWSSRPAHVDGSDIQPRVSRLFVLPSGVVLAATSNEVIRSADAGRTWAGTTLAGQEEVRALAASPLRRDLVIAVTGSEVFRSDDDGGTWTRVSTGPAGVKAHALAFMPSDDRVLFATTSGGLFRSDDEAATWRRVNGGLPRSDLTGIAIHPDGRTLYVSDFNWGGIFRSIDAGSTWKRMPTDGLASDRVWALALDPEAPERLLAASWAGGLHLRCAPKSPGPSR